VSYEKFQNGDTQSPNSGDIIRPEQTENRTGEEMKRNNRKLAALFAATAVIFTAFGAAGFWAVQHFTGLLRGNDAGIVIGEAYDIIDARFVGEWDSDTVANAAIDGMVSALDDQWSRYLTADEAFAYTMDQQNVIVGIGVTVSKTEGSGMLVEIVHAGGGAEEAGIVVGDMILAADDMDLVPLTLEEGKIYVTGDEGSFVSLRIRHADGTENEISVERKVVFIPPVSAEMIGNVGYIRLENFDDGAADAFLAELDSLLEAGAQGFVFDVRCNGGGYVREMIKILDRLLPEGEIFIHRSSDGKEDITMSDRTCLELPMAVLVNASSYSAAEYFAAVLQEYDAAVIVGEKTVGKGYSQQTFELSDGSALVLSTKMYCLPSRMSLAGVGITPDVEILLDEEADLLLYYGRLEEKDDLQLQTAMEYVS